MVVGSLLFKNNSFSTISPSQMISSFSQLERIIHHGATFYIEYACPRASDFYCTQHCTYMYTGQINNQAELLNQIRVVPYNMLLFTVSG